MMFSGGDLTVVFLPALPVIIRQIILLSMSGETVGQKTTLRVEIFKFGEKKSLWLVVCSGVVNAKGNIISQYEV